MLENGSCAPLVAVAVGNGLVVWHTREEWDTFMRGVDRDACAALGPPAPPRVVR